MNNTIEIIDNNQDIQSKIYNIRGLQVMLDSELANLYDVESKRLNEQVKRNIERFPEKFRFQLTEDEYENLRSQIATSSLLSQDVIPAKHGGRRYLPYVFTEQGVSMLSAVLNSKIAIEISIKIMDSFVNMRNFISSNNELFKKIETIKNFKDSHDRFMIIDNDIVYHIGASLKDLGKKWFAFSKIGIDARDILSKLK
jgi:hypothetical protein